MCVEVNTAITPSFVLLSLLEFPVVPEIDEPIKIAQLTTTNPIKLHQQHSRSKYASNILKVRNPISPKLLKPQSLNTIWHELLSWSYCLAFKHGDSFLDMTLGEVYWYD